VATRKFHLTRPTNRVGLHRRPPTDCMFNAAMYIRGALPVRYQFRSRTTLLVFSPSCALSASIVALLVAERLLSRKGLRAHSACGCRDHRVPHGDADGIRITRCYRTRVSSDWIGDTSLVFYIQFSDDEMEKQINLKRRHGNFLKNINIKKEQTKSTSSLVSK